MSVHPIKKPNCFYLIASSIIHLFIFLVQKWFSLLFSPQVERFYMQTSKPFKAYYSKKHRTTGSEVHNITIMMNPITAASRKQLHGILLLHGHWSEMTVVQAAGCTREWADHDTQSHAVTLTVLRTVCRSTPYPGTTRENTSCRGRMTLFWSSATRTTKRSVDMLIVNNAAHSIPSTQCGRCF